MSNETLHVAKKAKADEFYTQLSDIEKELKHYKHHFENKVVLCNCDDPYESNFFKYFALNFNVLKLKKLIATCYDSSPIAYAQQSLFAEIKEKIFVNTERHSYKIVINTVEDFNDDGAVDLSDVKYLLLSDKNSLEMLHGNGDFRSDECVKLLQEADIVCTNPPFSLFREYVALLMKYQKQFLIIGNQNAITYKEIFPLLKDNKIWLGINSGAQQFRVPPYFEKNNTYVDANGVKYAKFGNICWFTNLDIPKRHEELILYKSYNPQDYPKYDNYDAINVDRVSDIPFDYYPTEDCSGDIGVPITFLDKYNPEQFELIKFRKGNDEKDLTYTIHSADNLTDRQTSHAILPNHCPSQDVTESWGCQSHSLTSTTQSSLKSSVLQTAQDGLGNSRASLLSTENEYTTESLSREKCNGIMGVPITFMDKYNPDEFEILGLDDHRVEWRGRGPSLNGKTLYRRIIIKRKVK